MREYRQKDEQGSKSVEQPFAGEKIDLELCEKTDEQTNKISAVKRSRR